MIGMGMCLQNRLGEVFSEVAGRRMDFVCALVVPKEET
jgi:hypothetical protein